MKAFLSLLTLVGFSVLASGCTNAEPQPVPNTIINQEEIQEPVPTLSSSTDVDDISADLEMLEIVEEDFSDL